MSKPTMDTDGAKLAEIRQLRQMGKTWRQIAAGMGGVNPATLWKWARTGRAPQSPQVRRRLGLHLYAPAPVCPTCGVVHVSRRCPVAKRQPAGPRRVRYSERDTLAAIAMVLSLGVRFIYGHSPRSASD